MEEFAQVMCNKMEDRREVAHGMSRSFFCFFFLILLKVLHIPVAVAHVLRATALATSGAIAQANGPRSSRPGSQRAKPSGRCGREAWGRVVARVAEREMGKGVLRVKARVGWRWARVRERARDGGVGEEVGKGRDPIGHHHHH